ncbi:YqeG family HAD IIIA-type phosphatase [Prochlorococcus sp. MIT 1300]|uniref:YqeG family HAD IIIA-type phosphatase n=1 Tax=Prochlorococcus sp. MIT 1300 TaxID=3096218 RepID=UPI002A755F92|nr:YqeG family HAD IIIA-type phosphatase [Prochlorococcus sp. MIT 1300]
MHKHWLEPNWEPGLSIAELPINHFLELGIKGLVLDVDKTLLPGRDLDLPHSVKTWVIQAKEQLHLHLCSNNPSSKRIGSVAKELGIAYTCKAAKPRKRALLKVLNDLKIDPKKIAIIGDRIFTDILAGNRLGLYTVLVRPISHDGSSTRKYRVQKFEQKLAKFLGAYSK